MREYNRRWFLRVAAATTGGWIGLGLGVDRLRHQPQLDPVFKIDLDPYYEFVSFNEARDLAIRFDKMYDRLPEQPAPATQAEVVAWALEMIPMFEANGIVTKANWPDADKIGFALFPDGASFTGVAGRSDCENMAVLNLRFANPNSSWFQDSDWPLTLAHELAHVQQGDACNTYPVDLVENTAQIASWELIASLVNGGNTKLLQPLIGELRQVAVAAAHGIAMERGSMENFMELRNKLSPGALSAARFQAYLRRWAKDPQKFGVMLNRYFTEPLNMTIRAICLNDSKIKGLALPPVYQRGWPFQPSPRILKLDDLTYFLTHAEEMVREVRRDQV